MVGKIIKIILYVFLLCLLFFYRKTIIKKIRKIRDMLYGKYKWKRRKFLKKYYYFKTKNFAKLFLLKKIVLNFILLSATIIILILFFKSIDILKIENKQIKMYFTELDLKDKHYDFLWSQISSTLIVSTIIGFLGIFSTSYIYGKKQINIIFNEKGIFSLSKMFVYLIILIFVSLSYCINEGNSLVILLSFIVSLLIIFYMLFKVLVFYAFPRYYENSLEYEYLLREKKHIKKAMPLIPYKDSEIENFKYHTIELIQINDNEYNKNIRVLMDLMNISLFNNSKKIQEYYTEMIDRTDFISSILEIIEHLIINNKILEAINVMKELFYRLKYHRIVLIQDYTYLNIIRTLILKGKEINSELSAEKYFNALWEIIKKYIYFVYLYYCELDLSYCRLGKIEIDGKNSIHYFTHNNYLQDMYMSICENTYLTIKEKERVFYDLYTNIRLMELEEMHPECDVRHANEYMPINDNKISIPLIIKGEPIVLMFLKMFENLDINNIRLFTTMNISNELRAYIITLTSLALIEFINNGCIRKYVNDLNMKEEDIINMYIKSDFCHYFDASESLYKIFKEEYVKNNKRAERYYSLFPRVTLSLEVINNYYYYRLVIKCGNENEFYKITELEEFVPNEKIIEVFKKLKI